MSGPYPRCRCGARMTAAGVCPFGCRSRTHLQERHAAEAKLRGRERVAREHIYIDPKPLRALMREINPVGEALAMGRPYAPRKRRRKQA